MSEEEFEPLTFSDFGWALADWKAPGSKVHFWEASTSLLHGHNQHRLCGIRNDITTPFGRGLKTIPHLRENRKCKTCLHILEGRNA